MKQQPQRRRTDSVFGALIKSGAAVWDFIDRRQIDKHLVSLVILYGTVKMTEWAMGFAAALGAKPGLEVAAVIAAVTAPYMALQAAALAFYFKART